MEGVPCSCGSGRGRFLLLLGRHRTRTGLLGSSRILCNAFLNFVTSNGEVELECLKVDVEYVT